MPKWEQQGEVRGSDKGGRHLTVGKMQEGGQEGKGVVVQGYGELGTAVKPWRTG